MQKTTKTILIVALVAIVSFAVWGVYDYSQTGTAFSFVFVTKKTPVQTKSMPFQPETLQQSQPQEPSEYVPTSITIVPDYPGNIEIGEMLDFHVILGGEHTNEDLTGFTAQWRWTCDSNDTSVVFRNADVEMHVPHTYESCEFGDQDIVPCLHEVEYTLTIPGRDPMSAITYVGIEIPAGSFECSTR